MKALSAAGPESDLSALGQLNCVAQFCGLVLERGALPVSESEDPKACWVSEYEFPRVIHSADEKLFPVLWAYFACLIVVVVVWA